MTDQTRHGVLRQVGALSLVFFLGFIGGNKGVFAFDVSSPKPGFPGYRLAAVFVPNYASGNELEFSDSVLVRLKFAEFAAGIPERFERLAPGGNGDRFD